MGGEQLTFRKVRLCEPNSSLEPTVKTKSSGSFTFSAAQLLNVMMHESDDWFAKHQLHFAADEGDLERVKNLIEDGHDIHAFDNDLSLTPLHYAASKEHFSVVEYLLKMGADVNARQEEKIGETPLGEIADNCSLKMAQLLVSAGANPTLPGWMGLSALDRAKKREKAEGKRVYELLLKTAKEKFKYAS
ncbi:ankyrin repeat domain-containing protein [Rubidibacter lacunae]|uniref:ankyrin repeat domain-containing protein n=1 Tax=Rubidibacter lacunae TaxID=582514 RepID=UPI001E578FB9|nr:ankyrin repeat domain-containing protein [Rubidibacter lacunae]